jgi:hypothetical protein
MYKSNKLHENSYNKEAKKKKMFHLQTGRYLFYLWLDNEINDIFMLVVG